MYQVSPRLNITVIDFVSMYAIMSLKSTPKLEFCWLKSHKFIQNSVCLANFHWKWSKNDHFFAKNGQNSKPKKPKIRFFYGEKPSPRIVQKDRKNRDRIIRSGNSSCGLAKLFLVFQRRLPWIVPWSSPEHLLFVLIGCRLKVILWLHQCWPWKYHFVQVWNCLKWKAKNQIRFFMIHKDWFIPSASSIKMLANGWNGPLYR